MTAALFCDGCGKAEIDPAAVQTWFRVERLDLDGIDEIGTALISKMAMLPSLQFNAGDNDIEVEPDPLPVVTLHFCKASCGAEWFATAAALDS